MADGGPKKDSGNEQSNSDKETGASITLSAGYKKVGDTQGEFKFSLTHQKEGVDDCAQPRHDIPMSTNLGNEQQASNQELTADMTYDITTANFMNKANKVKIDMSTHTQGDDEERYGESDQNSEDEKRRRPGARDKPCHSDEAEDEKSERPGAPDKHRLSDEDNSSKNTKGKKVVKVKAQNAMMNVDSVDIDMRKKKKKKPQKKDAQPSVNDIKEPGHVGNTARPAWQNCENEDGQRNVRGNEREQQPDPNSERQMINHDAEVEETRNEQPKLDNLHLFLFAVILILVGIFLGKYLF